MNNNLIHLLSDIKKTHSNNQIAKALHIHQGTVDRWCRLGVVPDFYRVDLLRILGKLDYTAIEADESDQYYTKPAVAKKCVDYTLNVLNNYQIPTDDYHFIEPAAGCGHFYNLLPMKRRIGIDIDPKNPPLLSQHNTGIEKADFLTWRPKHKRKYITIGNPPFGRNGKTALDFVIHAFRFSDFVCFILPPIFDSTGKGSCKNRLTKANLIPLFTRHIKEDAFVHPNGREVRVKTIFQIWSKFMPLGYKKPKIKNCDNYVEIYNICIPYKPSRSPSNIDLIGKCDIYIPRTFWSKKAAQPSYDFYDMPYNDGYGLILKKQKQRIIKFIKDFNWSEVLHTSTNNSKSLRKDIIKEQIVRAGFYEVV